jgi:hypothetical protein
VRRARTGATVALYIGRGGCAGRGAAVRIAAHVPVRGGRWHRRWTAVRTLPAGRYAIHAELQDGAAPLVSTCAPGTVRVLPVPKRRRHPRYVTRAVTSAPAFAAADTCESSGGRKPAVPVLCVWGDGTNPPDGTTVLSGIADNDANAIHMDKPAKLHYGPYAPSGCKVGQPGEPEGGVRSPAVPGHPQGQHQVRRVPFRLVDRGRRDEHGRHRRRPAGREQLPRRTDLGVRT